MFYNEYNLSPPNIVLNKDPDALFYVSFKYEDSYYGSKTTALVVGQMQRFFILNGDFRKEYSELIPQGFEKCYEFFKNNIEHRNKHNHHEEIVPVEDLIALMNDYKEFLIRTRNK